MAGWGNTDTQANKPQSEATTFTIDSTSTDVVNATDDTINIKHGFATGDAVVYTTAGTAIAGLVSGTTYYIIAGDAAADTEHDYQLASSASNANAGTQIDITGVGDTATDTIQILAADVFGVADEEVSAATGDGKGVSHSGWVKRTETATGRISSVDTIGAADASRKGGKYFLTVGDTGVSTGGSGTANQGHDGGDHNGGGNGGSGGGGAGEEPSNLQQKGGDGIESNITGTPTYRGGGGGSYYGAGGLGGGGKGGVNASATPGTANTGGGGGGKGKVGTTFPNNNTGIGANGGSGVIIFKIPSLYSATFDATIIVSEDNTTIPNFRIYTITDGAGYFTIS